MNTVRPIMNDNAHPHRELRRLRLAASVGVENTLAEGWGWHSGYRMKVTLDVLNVPLPIALKSSRCPPGAMSLPLFLFKASNDVLFAPSSRCRSATKTISSHQVRVASRQSTFQCLAIHISHRNFNNKTSRRRFTRGLRALLI